MNTNSIEKKILLKAPQSRVWRALSDSTEFGTWFGVRFDQPFTAGAHMRGVIRPTTVQADVAKVQKEYEGQSFELTVDRIEPETLLSFRWHPHAVDAAFDYSSEPTTLVVFALEPKPEGVLLTVTETGFDQIPLERRVIAFTSNDQGWSLMIKSIEEYVMNAQRP